MNRRDFLKTLILLPFAGKLGGDEYSEDISDGKIALFWESGEGKVVRCRNCPHECMIQPSGRGLCGVRENRDGKLYTLVYGKPCSVHLDPIEKKPLYHFIPGSISFSIATVGCNLHCKYCQNYTISQAKPGEIRTYNLSPDALINNLFHYKGKYDIQSIAYTYTEPTVFIEYMLDVSKIAAEHNIKNVYHSNGFINQESLEELTQYLDGANIDLKFFRDESYKRISGGRLKPVLNTLKTLKNKGVWVEITYLMVPTINDSEREIRYMISWVLDNLGQDVPIHFSRFFPTYKLENLPRTSLRTIEDARELAMEMGVRYSYVGNVPAGHKGSNTYCPGCEELLIERRGYYIIKNNIEGGKCNKCGAEIEGIWG